MSLGGAYSQLLQFFVGLVQDFSLCLDGFEGFFSVRGKFRVFEHFLARPEITLRAQTAASRHSRTNWGESGFSATISRCFSVRLIRDPLST
jgi:hypothetical protein